MVEDARVDAGAGAYRGFLFSDLRGFTAFAERHGNTAAASMVSRFLEIARTAIARYEGAEIKTEGDAIHAVFPSASGAVMCGLEIVDAADDLNAREPKRTIALGVGVHAGEAVETAEGYIGRAVNIAARLCAVAGPGEVLVSSTVKGITQSSIPVGFIRRGKRRLKGIQDPILVYAVTRDVNARSPREVPWSAIIGASALAATLVAALVGAQLLPNVPAGPSGSSPAASVAPAAQPVVIGPMPIGTYRSAQFQPPITFEIPDPGWTANRDQDAVLGLIRELAPRGTISFLRVQEVIANPCTEGGEGTQTRPAAPDVISELQRLPHLTVSDPTAVQVGGFAGQQVEVGVSDGVLAACGGLAGGEAAIFLAGGETWGAASGERFRLVSVNVGDEPVTIVMSTDWTQTPSVQELENLLGFGGRIVASVRF